MITYDSIAAMKMNRALFEMNNKLNNINKQLKTGSSINRAADDPAVFNYTAKIKNYSDFYSVTNQNAQTGISMIDTGLESISSMQDNLKEIKTLLTSANAVLSASQRDTIQAEIDSLTQKIANTRADSSFNGLQLFELQGQYDGVPTNGYNYTSDYHQLTISDFENVQTLYAEGGMGGEEPESSQLTIDDFDDLSSSYFGGVEFQTGYHDFGGMGPEYCYLIENVDQLKVALDSQNKMGSGEVFVLLNDIDCSELMDDWGSYVNNCTIDGNRHVISNLTYNNALWNVALVAENYGEIRNLGVVNCTFLGYDASGICGSNYGSIENCYVDSCEIISDSLGYQSGGIAGKLTDDMGTYYGTVSNCYVTNTTISNNGYDTVSKAGGIVGDATSGSVDSCYVAGCTILAQDNAGGIAGTMGMNGGSITNCFAIDNSITANNMYSSNVGGIIGYFEGMGNLNNNYQDFDSMDMYSTYQETSCFANSDTAYALNSYGMFDNFEYIEGNDHPTFTWQADIMQDIPIGFSIDFRYGEYDGETYYFIENADQFSTIINGNDSALNDYISDKKFMLMADIDLSEEEYPGSNYNYAYIDGNGHKLINFNTIEHYSDQLIYENLGTIKNLGIENFTTGCATFLCDTNYGTIENVYIKNSIMQNDWTNDVGGFAVSNNGTISNCYIADSTIQAGFAQRTPICGIEYGTTSNCFVYNVNFQDSFGNATETYRVDTASMDQPSWWFNSEEGAATFGDAFEYVRGDNHITLKWENAGRSINIPGISALKDNSIRIQTGKKPTDYVTIDTTFYFDNNFNFDASSQENAVASLAKLQTVSDSLTAKTSELNSYRKTLVSEANSSLAKVNAANKTLNAWTSVDKDELQSRKEQLLSDIVNTKALRDQTIALNQQMCQMLILGAINNTNSSFSLFSPFSSNDWLTNLLNV